MATILVSPSRAFFRIAKTLYVRGHNLLVFNPDFSKQLNDVDVKHQNILTILNEDDKFTTHSQAVPILAGLSKPNGRGHDILPEAVNGLRRQAGGRGNETIPWACSMVEALDRARPELCLVHNDIEPHTRLVALWARARGVPCLHVPHSIYQMENRTRPGTDVHDLITASHIAVAGPFQYNWYAERGQPASRLRMTGLPQFDAWPPLGLDRERARRLLNIDSNAVALTYAASWRQNTNLLGCQDEHKAAFLAFLHAARMIKGVEFLVKLHPHTPKGGMNWHVTAARQAEARCQMLTQHLEVCLAASDAAFVYGGGNVLLEASFIPGMRLLTTSGYYDDPEVVKVAAHPQAMLENIVGCLQHPPLNLRGFQAKYLGLVDRQAGQRVIDWIEELV